MDAATIAFGGPAGGSGCEVESGFALLGELAACFETRLGFPVELLGDGGGSAHFTQAQDFDFEIAPFGFDGKHVADPHFAGGASGLMVGFDTTQLAGFRGECARFKEARRPQPFVETRADHAFHASGWISDKGSTLEQLVTMRSLLTHPLRRRSGEA
jgi:hypothetical protein